MGFKERRLMKACNAALGVCVCVCVVCVCARVCVWLAPAAPSKQPRWALFQLILLSCPSPPLTRCAPIAPLLQLREEVDAVSGGWLAASSALLGAVSAEASTRGCAVHHCVVSTGVAP